LPSPEHRSAIFIIIDISASDTVQWGEAKELEEITVDHVAIKLDHPREVIRIVCKNGAKFKTHFLKLTN
jgi:hypothetical protein